MYQHILVAIEGRSTDQAAVEHAAALARQSSARITLLWVVPVAKDDGGGLGRQFQIELGSSGWRRKNLGEKTLAALKKQLALGGLAAETALVVGDRSHADEIVAFSNEGDFDLIVMAADDRSWLYRTWFGCPADGVQRKATVPTLFVSDGTRRAHVASRQEQLSNPVMDIFGNPGL